MRVSSGGIGSLRTLYPPGFRSNDSPGSRDRLRVLLLPVDSDNQPESLPSAVPLVFHYA